MGGPTGGAPGTASAQSSVYTLLNSAIGAGVLSFPFAFRAAGWAGGVVATCLVAAIEGMTMYWLARYAEFTDSHTYSALARKMLGRKAALAMSTMLILYSFGAGTAYLIILGDCFQPMAAGYFGQRWWTSRHVVVPVLGSATMLPLCFPLSLDAISGFSSITLYALCCVVGAVAYRCWGFVSAPGYDWSAVVPWQRSLSFLDALPIMAFGFQCHTNLAAVFSELEEEPEPLLPEQLLGSAANLAALVTGGGSQSSLADLAAAAEGGGGDDPQQQQQQQAVQQAQRVVVLHRPRRRFVRPAGRSQKLLGMVQVLCVAIGLTAVFYVLVGLFGYLSFPLNALSNILLNYSEDDRLMQVARALVGIIQILHYPVNHSPARAALRDLLSTLTGHSAPFAGRVFNFLEVLAYFGGTLATALAVTDLGQVFKLIGGFCGAFFIFLMPGAFVLQYSYSKHVHMRDGGEPLLLPPDEGAQQQQQQEQEQQQERRRQRQEVDYHFLGSKLFWAGVALQLMGLGLIALTVYTLLAPPV